MIPTYNAQAHVAAAVRSALAQSLGTIEVIVVDDGSTDGTLSIVQTLAESDPRLRLERQPRNMGPAAARNRGFALARGIWIAVLDADDFMVPDRLAGLTAVAERIEADAIADNLVTFAEDNMASARLHLAGATPGWISAGDYLRQGLLFGSGRDYGYLKPIFRAERLRALGVAYNEQLRIAEDDDLMVRALIGGLKYWLEPTQTYFYRRHSNSTSHRLSAANARAMCEASAELIARAQASPQLELLAKRHRALRRGLAFVELVEALKRKSWSEAVRIGFHEPSALPLLRMPIRAALGRMTFGPGRERPSFSSSRPGSGRLAQLGTKR